MAGILDILSNLIGLNQKKQSRDGLASQAVDITRYHPQWQQEVIDGKTSLSFPDWLIQNNLTGQGAMPGENNAVNIQR